MPPNQVIESVLDEIDLDIVDPFGEGAQAATPTQGTVPIPQPTPPPQHNRTNYRAEQLDRLRQTAKH